MLSRRFLTFLLLPALSCLAHVSLAQETAGSPMFRSYTPASGSDAGGSFTFQSGTRIVFTTDEAQLIERLKAPRGWLDKLRAATGLHDLDVVFDASPDSDDIVIEKRQDSDFAALISKAVLTITTRTSSTLTKNISLNIANEGYKYKASSSGGVKLQYKEETGAFRAFQAITELVMKSSAASGKHRKLPYGEGIDYPNFEDRRFMIDVGRAYMPVDMIIAFIEKMSLHRLNQLQIHLNDDFRIHGNSAVSAIGASKIRGAFRLANERPGLAPAAEDRTPYVYTHADWRKIEDAAARNGVIIIPEFNSPGHSAAWYQDRAGTGISFRTHSCGHNCRIIDVNGDSSRNAAIKYMVSLMLSYRHWFDSGYIHMGGEESGKNTGTNVRKYLNTMYERLDNPNKSRDGFDVGYDRIEVWTDGWDGKHWQSGLNKGLYAVHWIDTMTSVRTNRHGKWIDLTGDNDGGFYYVPGSDGWNRIGIDPELGYRFRYNQRVSRWVQASTSSRSNPPRGLGGALWNDFTQTFYTGHKMYDMMNAGSRNSIPALGLLNWHGHIRDGDGNLVAYEDTGHEDLRPVDRETSAMWVRERFPYLSLSQAKKVLLDTARFQVLYSGPIKVGTTNHNSGFRAAANGRGTPTLVDVPKRKEWNKNKDRYGADRGGNNRYIPKENQWMLWESSGMADAFEGPPKLASGMFVADLAGEGNMMANGAPCRDVFHQIGERPISACDEDVWTQDISGSGGLHKKGVGKLKLTGTNTFAGGVMLDGGQLEIAVAGNLGAAAGNLALNGGTLSFAADVDLSARNMAIGSVGGGINANGNEVALGGVISGAGQLRISSASNVPVTKVATVTVIQGANTTVVLKPTITVGTEVMEVPGVVALSGSNTFSGGLMLESGTAQVGTNAALGAAAGGVTFAGGTLVFSSAVDLPGTRAVMLVADGMIDTGANAVKISGVISGPGSLIKTGSGNLELKGANTYANATRVSGGMLAADISSIPDASIIAAASGAVVELTAASDGKHDGIISGAGMFKKMGSSALTLKGASNPNWQIGAGKLVVESIFSGNIEFTGSGSGRIFEFKNDTTYAGVVSGNGQLVKSGGGELVISGDSGAFAGTSSVEANSTMFVDNMLGGNVNVKASGVLGGKGKVGGNVTVASAGKLAASRDAGFLQIGGDLDLDGTYEVIFGQGSVVDGDVDIGAAAVVEVLNKTPPYVATDNAQFAVLASKGALTGRFSRITESLPFVTITVTYHTGGTGGTVLMRAGMNKMALDDFLLGVVLPSEPDNTNLPPPLEPEPDNTITTLPEPEPDNTITTLPEPEPDNFQDFVQVVADVWNNQYDNLREGEDVDADVVGLINHITSITGDEDEAREKLAEIVEELGEDVATQESSRIASVASNTESRAVVSAQTRASFGRAGSESERGTRFSLQDRQWNLNGEEQESSPVLWVKAMVSKGDGRGHSAKVDYEYDGRTFLIGIDEQITDLFRLGFFSGVSDSEFMEASLSAENKSKHIGLYSGLRTGNFLLRSGYVYTSSDVDAASGGDLPSTSEYSSTAHTAFGELGYQFNRNDIVFEPFVGVSYTKVETEAHNVSYADLGGFVNSIGAKDTTTGVAEVGIHALAPLPAATSSSFHGLVSWTIPLKDIDNSISYTLGGVTSSYQGATPSLKGFRLEAGLDFAIDASKSISFSASYNGKLSDSDIASKQYSVEGVFSYSF